MASTKPSAPAGGTSMNVKVAVRCRPFNKREKGMSAKSVVEVEGGKVVALTDPDGRKADEPRSFVFDHSYYMDSTQEEVFEDLAKPIVEKALVGYNGTIFAYGQTGSGKTFSMMGEREPAELRGLIPRMNTLLFDRLAALQADKPALQFLVIVSYLEIYNEVIKDLLNPSDKQLNIREHPEMGVYVQDLAEIVVKNADDVSRLLEQGQKVRHVAATNMNERSSRSHSCFTIKIEQKLVERNGDKEKTTTLTAKINLVDLAGSERAAKTGATGDVLKQGAAINKSLSALGNVINALAEGNKAHIPYRGNSLTVMVAAISPADDNYDETLSTLQYANRAKNIKNDAKKNEDVNEQLIRQLREEIEALRKALAAAQSTGIAPTGLNLAGLAPGAAAIGAGLPGAGGEPFTDEQKAQMEELIANLERAKAQTWEEKQKMSALYESERKANLANENKIRSVMQTIKEDNMELMKRMRSLMADKTRLAKEFKAKKEGHMGSREALAGAMAQYQELYSLDGGREDGPHAPELEALLTQIENLHKTVEAEADELKSIKDQMKENERKIMEERAEAAAQRMLLEEDAELRKAIAEEERKRLEKDHAQLLEQTIEAERKRLREDADRERAALVARYGEAHSNDREQELELSLVDANSEKNMLLLEMSRVQQESAQEMRKLKSEHNRRIHDMKAEELRMFREMASGFEEERTGLEGRLNEMSRLLAMAVRDIEFLHGRNAELERQLLITAAWEPPVT